MATRKASDAEAERIDVLQVTKAEIHCHIVGTSPLILNRMSEKARRTLLLPGGPKTAAERQSTLKHDPMEEFAASPYRIRADSAPTLLAVMASAFKGAMATAALDLPGAKKAQIGRLVYVEGDLIGIYGEPQLFMSVARSADINHTPDIRTRVIVPQWACELTVTHVIPILRSQPVLNLLAAAGLTAGVGDWRPEKGKGSYGQFRLADADDTAYAQITATWGREQQQAAMASPSFYDAESEDLFAWWSAEAKRRGFSTVRTEVA